MEVVTLGVQRTYVQQRSVSVNDKFAIMIIALEKECFSSEQFFFISHPPTHTMSFLFSIVKVQNKTKREDQPKEAKTNKFCAS